MIFNFEITIKETKGAVNTAAKIADILKNTEVSFTTCLVGEAKGIPAIHAKLPGWEKPKFIAVRKTGKTQDFWETRREYGNWWINYVRNANGHGYEEWMFEHTTDAAKELVKEWIEALCDEYDRRLDADTVPEP